MTRHSTRSVILGFLDAQWSVPREDGELLMAAGLNAIHARRGLNELELPTAWPLFERWLESRWRAAVVADAEYAFAWGFLEAPQRRPETR